MEASEGRHVMVVLVLLPAEVWMEQSFKTRSMKTRDFECPELIMISPVRCWFTAWDGVPVPRGLKPYM